MPVVCCGVSDARSPDLPTPTPSTLGVGSALPPPGPPSVPDAHPGTHPDAHLGTHPAGYPGTVPDSPVRRPHRPGELTTAWRAALVATWVGVLLAYLAVWKASEEIGIGTWWLGPRSDPQPVLVRLIPFFVTAVFGILASYNVPRMPWISLGGSVVLALIAVPDLSRSVGLATIEFAIAGAAAAVSLASLTGTYRAAKPDADR
jgi:hypothetical protein